MAKKKADLIEEAQALGLEVNEKNTVAEITAAIKGVDKKEPAEKTEQTDKEQTEQVTKAGKRSAKALREQAEAEAKEARKSSSEEETEKPKQKQNPTRSKLERRSRGYRKAAELIDATETHQLNKGIELALKSSHVNFDATVEIHIRLNVDPKQADQNVRDSVVLPAGTGKSLRVAVFATDDELAAAKKAGADIAKGDEFLQDLDKGTIDFDVLIATPEMMPKLGKYARILGPKGLMPNPKSGTVTKDVAKAVRDAKAGKVEYRVDGYGIIHAPVGKVSFGAEKISKNLSALFSSVKSNKPSSVKGAFVQSIYLTTSMGPSVKIQPSELA